MVATVPYAVEKAVEKSASTTDETASTPPSRLDERAAEALQLYSPLQPIQLYSYTSSTLYNPLQHPSAAGVGGIDPFATAVPVSWLLLPRAIDEERSSPRYPGAFRGEWAGETINEKNWSSVTSP